VRLAGRAQNTAAPPDNASPGSGYNGPVETADSVAIPYAEDDPLRVPLKNGLPAPDFSLPVMQGSRWRPTGTAPRLAGIEYSNGVPLQLGLTSYRRLCAPANTRSRPTLLMFWAFWCDTWEGATHSLRALRPKLAQQGVDVLCVVVDASQQPVARQSLARGDLWFPIVIDNQSAVTLRYGVRRVPTLFLIDGAGRVQAHWEKFPAERTLMSALQAQKRSATRRQTPPGKTTGPSAASRNATISR
jgi:peroxiredoxin